MRHFRPTTPGGIGISTPSSRRTRTDLRKRFSKRLSFMIRPSHMHPVATVVRDPGGPESAFPGWDVEAVARQRLTGRHGQVQRHGSWLAVERSDAKSFPPVTTVVSDCRDLATGSSRQPPAGVTTSWIRVHVHLLSVTVTHVQHLPSHHPRVALTIQRQRAGRGYLGWPKPSSTALTLSSVGIAAIVAATRSATYACSSATEPTGGNSLLASNSNANSSSDAETATW